MHNNADYKKSLLCFYSLRGTILEVTAEISNVGLLKNHKLSWNSDIDKISSKTNKVLGLIKRNCREFLTQRTLY